MVSSVRRRLRSLGAAGAEDNARRVLEEQARVAWALALLEARVPPPAPEAQSPTAEEQCR
jgi:hypothetical protein